VAQQASLYPYPQQVPTATVVGSCEQPHRPSFHVHSGRGMRGIRLVVCARPAALYASSVSAFGAGDNNDGICRQRSPRHSPCRYPALPGRWNPAQPVVDAPVDLPATSWWWQLALPEHPGLKFRPTTPFSRVKTDDSSESFRLHAFCTAGTGLALLLARVSAEGCATNQLFLNAPHR
jgi:hypothetical protein